MKSKGFWRDRPELLNAGIRGWNATKMIPKLLKEAYPEMRGYTMGRFTAEDVPDRISRGYVHLTAEDFPDWEEMNALLPIRFGIRPDASGRIMYKDTFLMYMPKDFRAKQMAAFHERAEASVKAAVSDTASSPAPGVMITDSEVEIENVKAPVGRKPKKG